MIFAAFLTLWKLRRRHGLFAETHFFSSSCALVMERWGELSFFQWVFEKRLCILEKRRCVVFLIKVSERYACFSKVPESCKQSVCISSRGSISLKAICLSFTKQQTPSLSRRQRHK
jgi:hypothetical protein